VVVVAVEVTLVVPCLADADMPDTGLVLSTKVEVKKLEVLTLARPVCCRMTHNLTNALGFLVLAFEQLKGI